MTGDVEFARVGIRRARDRVAIDISEIGLPAAAGGLSSAEAVYGARCGAPWSSCRLILPCHGRLARHVHRAVVAPCSAGSPSNAPMLACRIQSFSHALGCIHAAMWLAHGLSLLFYISAAAQRLPAPRRTALWRKAGYDSSTSRIPLFEGDLSPFPCLPGGGGDGSATTKPLARNLDRAHCYMPPRADILGGETAVAQPVGRTGARPRVQSEANSAVHVPEAECEANSRRRELGNAGWLSVSGLEPQREHQQANVGCDAEGREHRDDVSTGPKALPVQSVLAHLGEELFVACTWSARGRTRRCVGWRTFMPAEQAREQDACAIDGKQGPDGVELGREDLQHDEREGKLADGRPDVGSLKGPLSRADLHKLRACKHD